MAYGQLPQELVDATGDLSLWGLYALVDLLAGRRGWVRTSAAELAEGIELHRSNVAIKLRALERLGFIHVDREGRTMVLRTIRSEHLRSLSERERSLSERDASGMRATNERQRSRNADRTLIKDPHYTLHSERTRDHGKFERVINRGNGPGVPYQPELDEEPQIEDGRMLYRVGGEA